MTLETRIRSALREAADTTPVPERWDAIVGAGARRPRRRKVLLATAAALAVGLALVTTLAVVRDSRRAVVVSVGPPHRAPLVSFDDGPTVDLGALVDGRLAFVSGGRLYVADAREGSARRLTEAGEASALAWSSDGEWIAFRVRNAPGYEDYTTWIARHDGSEARALEGMSGTYAWSPTGHRLAIASYCCTEERRGSLHLVDPNGETHDFGGVRAVAIAWAPDGSSIAYTSLPILPTPETSTSIWAVDPDGGEPERVADGVALIGWSPDGRSMIRQDMSGRTLLVDLTTGESHAIGPSASSALGDPAETFAWSTQTDRLAVAVSASATEGGIEAIAVCRSDGSACERRADGDEGLISRPAFSPDGEYLTYVRTGRRTSLRLLHIPSGPSSELDDMGDTDALAPVNAWLADGSVLYRRGPELRLVDPATGRSRRLASPIGYLPAGSSVDQGSPAGAPVAAWQLTARRE